LRFSRLCLSCDFRNKVRIMDVIDANWIKQHLTNRHGELAELSRGTGIGADKITKILKGERRVSAAEGAAIYRHLFTNAPGLSEPPAAFTPAQAIAVPVVPGIATQLAPKVRRPMAYQIARAVTSALLAVGDVLIIDTDKTSGDNGLVVVNVIDPDSGAAETQLRRAFHQMLIATDPDDPEPVITMGHNSRCGIIGTVAASYRQNSG
jgi:hypothetical protein